MFVPLWPFINLGSGQILLTEKLNSINGSNRGKMTIFDNTTKITSNDRILNLEMPRPLAFFVLLRDENGNYDSFFIVAFLSTDNLSDLFNANLIFGVVFIILSLSFLIIFFRGKRRQTRHKDYDMHTQNLQNQNKSLSIR